MDEDQVGVQPVLVRPKARTAIEHMGTITTFVLMLAVIFGLSMGCYELFKVVTGQ